MASRTSGYVELTTLAAASDRIMTSYMLEMEPDQSIIIWTGNLSLRIQMNEDAYNDELKSGYEVFKANTCLHATSQANPDYSEWCLDTQHANLTLNPSRNDGPDCQMLLLGPSLVEDGIYGGDMLVNKANYPLKDRIDHNLRRSFGMVALQRHFGNGSSTPMIYRPTIYMPDEPFNKIDRVRVLTSSVRQIMS